MVAPAGEFGTPTGGDLNRGPKNLSIYILYVCVDIVYNTTLVLVFTMMVPRNRGVDPVRVKEKHPTVVIISLVCREVAKEVTKESTAGESA